MPASGHQASHRRANTARHQVPGTGAGHPSGMGTADSHDETPRLLHRVVGAVLVCAPQRRARDALVSSMREVPQVRRVTAVATYREAVSACAAAPVDTVVIALHGVAGDGVALAEAATTIRTLYEEGGQRGIVVLIGAAVPPARVLCALLQAGADVVLRWTPTATTVTGRQHQLLSAIAEGHSIPEIATTLGIGAGKVNGELARLYRTLGSHNRLQAISHAFRTQLLA